MEIVKLLVFLALFCGIAFMLMMGARERALSCRGHLDLPMGVKLRVLGRMTVGSMCVVERVKPRTFFQNKFFVLDWEALSTGKEFEIVKTIKGKKVEYADNAEQGSHVLTEQQQTAAAFERR